MLQCGRSPLTRTIGIALRGGSGMNMANPKIAIEAKRCGTESLLGWIVRRWRRPVRALGVWRGSVAVWTIPAMILVAGCAVNPATGERSFTAFMSPEQEKQVGESEFPKLVNEFGGAYDDQAIQDYVNNIGQLLARTSEMPDLGFTFTVIDSPVVNAFALPGGYVSITRGLLALAESEAEVASVVAHEIGHVTARHTAQRYSRAVLANIGAVALGVATGSGDIAKMASAGGALYLQSYSRDQEFQADQLGVRYLSRGSYQPVAMSSFLAKLLAHSQLEAELAGKPGAADQFNIMQTHPRTIDRVNRAIAAAGTANVPDPVVERDSYLDQIDGLLYGDNPEQGLIRGQVFAHPVLRFQFVAPPDYRLYNSARQVSARRPDGALMVFDRAPPETRGDITDYMVNEWAADVEMRNVERITVNGMAAVTGESDLQTKAGEARLRLVVYRYDADTVYRMAFLTPAAKAAEVQEDLRRTTYSFRKLSTQEASQFKPLRLRVVRVGSGVTVADLAARMAFDDFKEARFRTLNGLDETEELKTGQRVKLVIE